MLVSVVIVSQNSSVTLEAALNSALEQSLPRESYEVLLIDDGSSDRTAELAGIYLKSYSNLRYLRFPSSRGRVAAYNYGLQAARGEYFVRLDSEDALHHEMLSLCVEPLEDNSADFVYCDRYEVSLDSQTHSMVSIDPFNPALLIDGGALLRTELVQEIGGYRPLYWESCDLYIRYARICKLPVVRVPKALYYSCRLPRALSEPENAIRGWQEMSVLWDEATLEELGIPSLEPSA